MTICSCYLGAFESVRYFAEHSQVILFRYEMRNIAQPKFLFILFESLSVIRFLQFLRANAGRVLRLDERFLPYPFPIPQSSKYLTLCSLEIYVAVK